MKNLNTKRPVSLVVAVVVFLLLLGGCNAADTSQTYELSDFDAFFEKMIALGQAEAMFSWDIDTGGAPPGAMDARAGVMATLSAERFAMGISDEMRNFFTTVEAAMERGEVDAITLAIYRETKRDYDKLLAIPSDEYKAFSELTTNTYLKWLEAREKNDYGIFAPYLQEIIDYQRKVVEYRAQAGMVYDNPYDAMLDDYEPGMTVEILDAFFEELRAEIVPLLRDITAARGDAGARAEFLDRKVPLSVQRNVSKLLMDTVGYDLDRGGIGEVTHPFSISFGQSDVRITAHYVEDDPFDSLYTVMHESGHAIYWQNVAKELEGTILDDVASMGLSESQARFLENMAGRSYEFLEGIYDEFISVTEGYYDDVSVQELYEGLNTASPSLIRVNADELTYSLHIMIRYEIEKMIFNDPELKAADLPELWNEKTREYLGLTPGSYAEGILQDVHWAHGLFGYFPTYALGNAYAAQIRAAMEKDFDLSAALRALDFATINGWLAEKIHRHGALLEPAEVLAQFTDEGLNAKYYIDYLKLKFQP